MKKKPQQKGPKTIPSCVNLPGGIQLQGLLFRVTDYDDLGRPSTFEILQPGETAHGAGVWTLYAHEASIRKPGQDGGRKKALTWWANNPEALEIVRRASDTMEARAKLLAKYALTEDDADAILDCPLSRVCKAIEDAVDEHG